MFQNLAKLTDEGLDYGPFDGKKNSLITKKFNTIDNVNAKIDNVKAKVQDEED
jgi:hypothetical protein